jgi:Fe-S-cluster containining protein
MEITKDTTITQAEKLATCDKCGKCCKFGSGFLVKADLTRIAAYLDIDEKKLKKKYLEEKTFFNKKLYKPKLKKKPFGECTFYKANKCLIHKVKPLQCRTASCNEQGEGLNCWFIVNYAVNKDDPESIRQYKHYLEENPPIKGASLKDLIPDEKELNKILNFEILR